MPLGQYWVTKPVEADLTGIVILKSLVTRVAGRVAVCRYEEACELLCAFGSKNNNQNMYYAWIRKRDDPFALSAAGLESRGLSLENGIFLETSQSMDSAFFDVCQQERFRAIVVEGNASPGLLQQAKRWAKPKLPDGLVSADVLSKASSDRLVIFLMGRS